MMSLVETMLKKCLLLVSPKVCSKCCSSHSQSRVISFLLLAMATAAMVTLTDMIKKPGQVVCDDGLQWLGLMSNVTCKHYSVKYVFFLKYTHSPSFSHTQVPLSYTYSLFNIPLLTLITLTHLLSHTKTSIPQHLYTHTQFSQKTTTSDLG